MNVALVPGDERKRRLEMWMESYGDAVLRTCYMILSDRAQAEDALQDTFLKVWRSMDSFEGRNGSSEKTWILKIAVNTCKNYRVSAWNRRIDKTKIIEELPPAVTGVAEESRDMFLSVMGLDQKLRQVVILYYYHALTYKEIGEITNLTAPAVKKRLDKAVKTLKTQLYGRDEDERK